MTETVYVKIKLRRTSSRYVTRYLVMGFYKDKLSPLLLPYPLSYTSYIHNWLQFVYKIYTLLYILQSGHQVSA
jgi:hypothetical protein